MRWLQKNKKKKIFNREERHTHIESQAIGYMFQQCFGQLSWLFLPLEGNWLCGQKIFGKIEIQQVIRGSFFCIKVHYH